MKRAISGIKPTGDLTLGNYLGAIKHWVKKQDEYDELLLFIPDLHSLNIHPSPEVLREKTRSTIAWLLAAGIDPEKTIIFSQSQVSAHAELAVILSNYVSMGELSRQTQFKDKVEKHGKDGIWAGFFTYPTLMAADILLYDIHEVPVGDDQRQHVELTRDIAERFNSLYGDVFVLPEAVFGEQATRVMDLQHPERKMSKSDEDTAGVILLEDDTEVVKKKIMRAQTDSDSLILRAKDKSGISNLIEIFAASTGRSADEIESEFSDSSYGEFKKAVAHSVSEELRSLQSAYTDIVHAQNHIESILEHGKSKATAIASIKLQHVKKKIGLI